MGQSCKIINQRKQQYLDTSTIPSSSRFPSLIRNAVMCRAVTWLVCSSENYAYKEAQEKGYYSQQYMGAWFGDEVEVIGDYDEEEFCYLVRSEYQNIDAEAMAMILENDEDLLQEFLERAKSESHYFYILAKVGLLEHCSKQILYHLDKYFGNNWKVKFYTRSV